MTRPACVFRNGHWSPRDLLADLSPPMREALADAARGPLRPVANHYFAVIDGMTILHLARTVESLARRGLLVIDCGPQGLGGDYRVTPRGRERAAEIARRAAAREKIGRRMA